MSDKPQNVDAYLERLTPGRREALETLRSVVREMAPEAEETMRYGMPTYERNGEVLCSFASQKNYISLYMDVDLVEQHRDELAGLDVGKSCIRFRKVEKLPLDTVRSILRETAQAQGVE
ncbi:MAG TPA: DUF1801 domain-containing protein [Anaerolineae bacterium]|nr:DUF1801 domain-containing protein [Anaerolineae bacterium]